MTPFSACIASGRVKRSSRMAAQAATMRSASGHAGRLASGISTGSTAIPRAAESSRTFSNVSGSSAKKVNDAPAIMSSVLGSSAA